jgi:HPt (histidine-containing phosphotransfer) domain-containing protein
MPADAVIDLEHLARYTGGDVALNAEILRLFDTQTSELVAGLRAILDARDEKSWKEVTHTIKGAARGVGAFAMADAAAQCELLGIVDPGVTEMAIAKLKSETEAVQAFVKAHCAR